MRVTYALPFLLLPFANVAAQGVVAPTAAEINPILVGSTIPVATLTDINGRPFDLMESAKSKPTILVYYRGGW